MFSRWDVRPEQVAWVAVGLVVLVVVSFVVYKSIGGIVLGLFLYYGTRPVYEHVHERVGRRRVSAAIALATVGLPMIIVLGYAALTAYQEAATLLNSPVASDIRQAIRPFVSVQSFASRETWTQLLQGNTALVRRYSSTLFAWGIRLFIMVTVAYYLLRDGHAIGEWVRDSFDDFVAVDFLEGVDDDLDTIYTGNLLTIGITGVIAAATFYLFATFAPGDSVIQYPILLGMLVGVGTLIPVLGMVAVYVPFAGILFLRAYVWNLFPVWVPVAFLAITFVVVDTIPDLLLRSYVSKGGINMGLMILAYALGAEAFGWWGVFFGPIVLVVFLHFAQRVLPSLAHGISVHIPGE
ncbi:AI-2E family transporter [Halorubellus sp. JP-L1]|uniref:AI-2E family transporter n=1 Tax=Halorubellus sp. JP-L1 TaxID=2715753 RepID=UPI001408D45D|nr:AI-2E family transporter [Halorubellus sp. JP-L1]NHN42718.1 AI-2E family transporter [Halorubellus sp. JP-L1]